MSSIGFEDYRTILFIFLSHNLTCVFYAFFPNAQHPRSTTTIAKSTTCKINCRHQPPASAASAATVHRHLSLTGYIAPPPCAHKLGISKNFHHRDHANKSSPLQENPSPYKSTCPTAESVLSTTFHRRCPLSSIALNIIHYKIQTDCWIWISLRPKVERGMGGAVSVTTAQVSCATAGGNISKKSGRAISRLAVRGGGSKLFWHLCFSWWSMMVVEACLWWRSSEVACGDSWWPLSVVVHCRWWFMVVVVWEAVVMEDKG